MHDPLPTVGTGGAITVIKIIFIFTMITRQVIAIALMYLAAKLSKFEVKDWKNKTAEHKHW